LFPASRIDSEWRRGQRRNAREVHEQSGANLFLAEAPTIGEALKEALGIVSKQSESLRKAKALATEMELDLGFDAALPDDAYSTSLVLGPQEAALLGELGIVLRLTMYRADTGDSAETD
jgi:hypothetical protein